MFQPMKSWVKPALLMRRGGDSARVLDHEQSHFDLSEVHARRLRKTFSELSDPCTRTEADMNAIVTKHLKEDFDVQQRYDRESVWGLDGRRQSHWDAEIRKQLVALAKYVH
jgi:predicted secreted Zn-dependent protease